MREEVKSDLIKIWASALELIEEGEFDQLKALSDRTIHNSSIFGDEFSITAAVLVYSLAKISQRYKLNLAKVVPLIAKLLQSLGAKNQAGYRKAQKSLLNFVSERDRKFNFYVDEVLDQAKIKKGWKLYEHGLSLGSSAHMLGISKWDLMNYLGNTQVSEGSISTDVKSRLSFTRRLF